MGEAVVEPLAACEREDLRRPGRRRERLADPACASVLADRRVRVAPVVEELGRVREWPRGEGHLVTARLQQLDQWPQDDDMRRVGQVDPDVRHQSGRSIE